MAPATVASSEFRRNFAKYLSLVEVQDVQVTRNGKVVGLWTSPKRDKERLVEDLAGSVHASIDFESDLAERRATL